jgi:NADP-dependent 3-hydroxy acid dehydrogenase YdfG
VLNLEPSIRYPGRALAAQALNRIAIAPDDIARAVIYALNQPENVTVNDLIISPTRQDW